MLKSGGTVGRAPQRSFPSSAPAVAADALKLGWGKPLMGLASVMVLAWIYKVIQL